MNADVANLKNIYPLKFENCSEITELLRKEKKKKKAHCNLMLKTI